MPVHNSGPGQGTQEMDKPGLLAFMLHQEHEQDPSSTIALEVKRACTLFVQTPDKIKADIVSQLGVVSFWTLWEKSTTLDAVHCLAPFAPNNIDAPHLLKHQIIGLPWGPALRAKPAWINGSA
jgi:hypothetical protein